MSHIVVIDDERSMREFLQILLEREGHEVVSCSDVKGALAALEDREPDMVFSDLKLPDGTGMEVLKTVRERYPDAQVIMMTAFATAENAVEAMRLGAYDYQLKPFKVSEVRALTQKALEKVQLLRDNRALRAQLKGLERLVGQSARMREVAELVGKVAPTKTSVLIEGESGTGKELVARAIHEASPRAAGPFVPVNFGAIPETLIEAELFGHAAGAFTGAARARGGLFEAAHQGTLLLDEVGELPASMQVKLLRVLQERSVRRVGEERERPIDVRILAATNKVLQDMVRQGSFREDLYYRLNVVRIVVPPLRERLEDVPLLARAFMARFAQDQGKVLEGIAPEAMRALTRYGFPGNVRELENYMERAVALAGGALITLGDLPEELRAATPDSSLGDLLAFPEEGVELEGVLASLERRLIEEAMRRAGGVKTRAAELLGLSFRSLRYRLQRLGVESEGEGES